MMDIWQRVILFDGTAYDPSDTDENKKWVWIHSRGSGSSFGKMLMHLKFENAIDLGNDSSGNNNDFINWFRHRPSQFMYSPTNGD